MIKAIIFDCWDTLIFTQSDKPHLFSIFAERIGRSIQDYEYLKVFEKHFMLEKHSDLKVPIKRLLIELNIAYTEKLIEELEKILEDTFKSQKDFPEIGLLNELKKRYKLGLITNTFYQSFKGLEEKFNMSKLFTIILKSYEIEILKPDPRVFEIMINRLNVNKNEAVMVGDSLKDDIEAAERFGIKGVLIDRKNKHPEYPNRITSLEQLKKFL